MNSTVLKTILSALALLAALLLAACGSEVESDHDESCTGTEHAEQDGHDDGDDHEGHAHSEGSDLGRSVEELFAENCEHDMAAHRCDECRYEVGVALVPESLLESGLLQVETIKRRDLHAMLTLNGEIQFDERRIAHLGPRVGGVVETVHVDLGDRVEAGRLLVGLTSHELAEAQSTCLLSIENLRIAAGNLDRQKALHADRISSEREYLESRQAFHAAEIEAQLARQRLLRLGLTATEIDELQAGKRPADGRLGLRAPFAGEVLSLHAVLGEQFESGEEIILLGDAGRLWVWVDIYEAQLADLARELEQGPVPAEVFVQSYPGRGFPGEIDHLNRWMDEDTRTVKARLILDNAAGLLHPGMFSQVRISLGGGQGRAAVPEEAVLEDEGSSFVFVHHEDDYFVRRPVRTGHVSDGWVELLEGPKPGRTVAAAGAFLLKSDVLRSKMGEGCAH